MGSSQNVSPLSTRQQYLRLIDKRKRRYARQNSLHLSISLLVGSTQDWKQPVARALLAASSQCSWAYWPSDLRRLVWDWNAGQDSKWRSNVLWFDYLKASKSEFHPEKAKSLLDYLRSHLSYLNLHTNAIAALIHGFAGSFERFYVDTAAMWREGEAELAVDIMEMEDFRRVLREILCFVEVAAVAFEGYYGGEEFGRLVKSRAVDSRELILEEIMKTRVHSTLLRIYEAANASREALYLQKLKDLSDLTCADLGISPLFCLDTAGYQSAIEALRELAAVTGPMAKMTQVMVTTRRLCECVDLRWKDCPVPADRLVINADQILSIFTYIVVKARVRNLMAQVAMIVEFVKPDVQQGPIGYYLATLEAAIEHVLIYPSNGSAASTNP